MSFVKVLRAYALHIMQYAFKSLIFTGIRLDINNFCPAKKCQINVSYHYLRLFIKCFFCALTFPLPHQTDWVDVL